MNYETVGSPNYNIPLVFGNPFQQQQQQQQPQQQQQQPGTQPPPQQGLAQLLYQKYLQYQQQQQPADQFLNDRTVAMKPPGSAPATPSGDNSDSSPQQSSGDPQNDNYWGFYQYLRSAMPGLFGGS